MNDVSNMACSKTRQDTYDREELLGGGLAGLRHEHVPTREEGAGPGSLHTPPQNKLVPAFCLAVLHCVVRPVWGEA